MEGAGKVRCCLAWRPGAGRFASVPETAERWGHARSYVTRLCAAGRVPGAFKVFTFEAFPNEPYPPSVWRIPADAPKPTLLYTRLTEAERDEIARRALEGEGPTPLAHEYGVTRAYVHRLRTRKRKERR